MPQTVCRPATNHVLGVSTAEDVQRTVEGHPEDGFFGKQLESRGFRRDEKRRNMTGSVSKEIPTKRRAPAVTFVARPTGLSIIVTMPKAQAELIAAKAAKKARAKASASRTVLSALRELVDEETRDRSGCLQANIPSQLKADLAELAKAQGTDVTALILDRLAEWIDPITGERRLKKVKNGPLYHPGPKNYRTYVRATDAMYSEALKARSLVRLQIEVGVKIEGRIRSLLGRNRISKGRFLTAVADDVRTRIRASTLAGAETGETTLL